MMEKLFRGMLACAVACGWSACSRIDEGESARRAALSYYDCLIESRYGDYVAGIAYCDSMTEDYRSQMVDLVAQYAAREREKRGGILSVQALDDTLSGGMASIFLEVLFADSTREEVIMPMVKCGDVWKMQ